MTTENANGAVAVPPPDVLHVNMIDAVGKLANKADIVDALVAEVRGIVIEAEARVMVDGGQGALGRGDIEGDFGRMDLKREVDVFCIEHVEDRPPAPREIVVALLQIGLTGRWKSIECVPDCRASEAVYNGGRFILALSTGTSVKEKTCGLCCRFHFLRRTLAHAFRLAVAPDIARQDGLVPPVDQIAIRVAHQMTGNGMAGKTVLPQQSPLFRDVVFFRQSAINFKVIAPAGELNAIVPHFFDEWEQLGGGTSRPIGR